MSRGATAYATRGTALALPRGSLENPALRVGGQRSGLLRFGSGLVLAVQKFPALEATQDGLQVRSNMPGDATVRPLALQRMNPTTADNQETALDVSEAGTLRGRLASYRQAGTKYGWRLYGSTGGALSTDLTVDGDGSLQARTDVIAYRDVWAKHDLKVDHDATITGNLTATGGTVQLGALSAPSLSLNGPVNTTTLTVSPGNATIGGQLTLSRAAGTDALVVAAGRATFAGDVTLGVLAQLTLNRTAGNVALSIPSGHAQVGGYLQANGNSGSMSYPAIFAPNGYIQSNSTSQLALYAPYGGCQIAGTFLGNGLNTQGGSISVGAITASGNVGATGIVQANSSASFALYALNGGVYAPSAAGHGFFGGNVQVNGSLNGGVLGSGTLNLGVLNGNSAAFSSGAGWGVTVTGALGSIHLGAGSGTQSIAQMVINSAGATTPAAVNLWQNGGTHALVIGLAGSAGHFLAGAAGDASIYTGTNRALVFGVNGSRKMALEASAFTIDAGCALQALGGVRATAYQGNALYVSSGAITYGAAVGGPCALPTTCHGFVSVVINGTLARMPYFIVA